MQISSRADKRCNDGCQFPPHCRLPRGMMEDEKTMDEETEEGRAMMRDELEKKKLEQTCFVVCLFLWETDGRRDRDCMSKSRV